MIQLMRIVFSTTGGLGLVWFGIQDGDAMGVLLWVVGNAALVVALHDAEARWKR